MNWLKTIFITAMVVWMASCTSQQESNVTTPEFEPIPDEVKQAIEKEFPGALPYRVAIDSLLTRLAHHNITADQILWGQSTCVDDITNTKDKLIHPEIKGPFTLGGLGGLPFTGVTGVDAFAHHVPENGTAILFVGPHIGYRTGEGWGRILRHGQHESSSCCGALYAALDKLKKNEIRPQVPSEDDYQEQVIEQLALLHQEEVLKASEPLVALTRVVSQEALKKMTSYAQQVRHRHFAYAVAIVGVVINTDYQYDDYLWIGKVAIKDIKKDAWLEGSLAR